MESLLSYKQSKGQCKEVLNVCICVPAQDLEQDLTAVSKLRKALREAYKDSSRKLRTKVKAVEPQVKKRFNLLFQPVLELLWRLAQGNALYTWCVGERVVCVCVCAV